MDTTLYRILVRPTHSPEGKVLTPRFFNVDSMTLTELYVKSDDGNNYKIRVVGTVFKSAAKKREIKTGSKTLNKYFDQFTLKTK